MRGWLAAVLVIAGCARGTDDSTVTHVSGANDPAVTELVYATPYSPTHPFSRADQRWMDFVNGNSEGRLIVRPVWSGALLSSDMSMEELRHGVADIGLITPIYARGGSHLIRIQSGFYSGADSIESQLEVYECLHANLPQMRAELEGLEVLAVQGGLLPGILTRSRPVRDLDDLRGLRIRAPTELLPVLQSLGADAVNPHRLRAGQGHRAGEGRGGSGGLRQRQRVRPRGRRRVCHSLSVRHPWPPLVRRLPAAAVVRQPPASIAAFEQNARRTGWLPFCASDSSGRRNFCCEASLVLACTASWPLRRARHSRRRPMDGS